MGPQRLSKRLSTDTDPVGVWRARVRPQRLSKRLSTDTSISTWRKHSHKRPQRLSKRLSTDTTSPCPPTSGPTGRNVSQSAFQLTRSANACTACSSGRNVSQSAFQLTRSSMMTAGCRGSGRNVSQGAFQLTLADGGVIHGDSSPQRLSKRLSTDTLCLLSSMKSRCSRNVSQSAFQLTRRMVNLRAQPRDAATSLKAPFN